MPENSIPNRHCAVKPHPLAELLLLAFVPIIRAFVSVAPLTPKALPPTQPKGEQNLSNLFDQLIADAEATTS